MKKYIIITIFLIISLFFLVMIQNNSGANTMDDKILRMKFDSQFEQTPAFLIVKVKNTDTKEQMDILCTNTQWAYHCINSLKLVKDKYVYSDYMMLNHDKVFETPPRLYGILAQYRAGDTYTGKYKTKEEFAKLPASDNLRNINGENIAQKRDLLKLWVKFTPIIRQKPNGTVFEDKNIAAYKYKPKSAGGAKVSAKTLKERFSDFSTSPVFVLIKIKNAETGENTEISCENETWAGILVNKLQLATSKNYTGYMVKNHNKVFEVDSKTYESLKKSSNSTLVELLKQDRIIRRNCLDGSIMY